MYKCIWIIIILTTIDKIEIENFSKLAKDWWDPNGKFRPLHLFNPARIAFIKDKLISHFKLNLDDKEMSLYNSISRILEKNIPEPDLVIFLQADTGHLMNNINKRGREYEKNMDWKYIDALNQVYNEFFFRYDKSPLLIINTNEIDFVNDQNDMEDIIDFVRTPGDGTRYFNPMKNI